MVSPVAVDVQEPRGVADLVDAELLHDAERRGVLGSDRHLDPVQADRPEAVVDRHRHGAGDDAAAGVRLVDPVADRGELRGAADDVADSQLAHEPALVLDDERKLSTCPGLAAHLAHHGGEAPRLGLRLGRCGGVPATEPERVGLSHATPHVPVVLGDGPQPHPAGHEVDRPAGAQWSLPTICSTACCSRGTTTARPSLTPPREPGRLTTSACAIVPATPRDRAAVATPLPTPCARIASAMPGTSRSSNARVTSGVRSVGVRPVPPVVITARAPSATAAEIASPTASPSGTTTGSPTSQPPERNASTMSGPVVSSYTPAAARLDATTTVARNVLIGGPAALWRTRAQRARSRTSWGGSSGSPRRCGARERSEPGQE